jgi:hypothetical protein
MRNLPKLRRDAKSERVELEDYLVDMLAHSVLGAVAGVIRSGSQDDIPKIIFERIK